MAKHEIEIEFDEAGRPTFHVKGLRGKGCAKILAEIEKALGVRVGEVKYSAEYYQADEKVKVGR